MCHPLRSPRARAAARARLSLFNLALLALTWIVGLTSCNPNEGSEAGVAAVSGNVLQGLRPSKVDGVRRPEVLTDGVMARTSDSWNTELTAVFHHESSFVEFDLGTERTIHAGYLQADNNDTYVITLSEDGSSYRPLWNAPPRQGLGLQERASHELNGTGRFVRISALGGDHAYSLSEVQLFADVPAVFPPQLPMRSGLEVPERLRSEILLFGFALGVLLLATFRGSPLVLRLAAIAFAVAMGIGLLDALATAWPAEEREVSLVRAASGALAAFVVLAEAFMPRRFKPSSKVAIGVLAACSVAAIAAFFNLGYPQFRDHRTDEPCFVHNFDMRVYYPVAKYFHELHFDGLYLASVAAYVDDTGVSLASLAKVELRDLRTHRITRVADVGDEIQEVRQRFSPERWSLFKSDMRYFRQQMGSDDYLGSMTDHGGNATPVWLAIASILYSHTTASNETLLAGAVLDPLLLTIMFVMIWRTFGIRTMLVSAVMFGANDFYMFGTDWAGATLRHDWLAYLGIGICLLRKERFAAGGALLAMSAMIRAFPALALVTTAIPFGYFVWDEWRQTGKLPTMKSIGWQHPLVRTAIGAAVCLVTAWLLSSILLSFGAWIQWIHKVSILDRDPHVNDVSLRGLIAGSMGNQRRVLLARMPLFIAAIIAFVVAIIAAARGKRWDQAAALGTILIPVVFNPANYYLHFICVLPLLAMETMPKKGAPTGLDAPPVPRADAINWAILTAMCAAQYWTTLTRDTDLHFQSATAIFFTAIAALLANTIHAGLTERATLVKSTEPIDEPAPEPALVAATAEAVPPFTGGAAV
ncbi:MAG TPA: hypothetical protein VGL13_18035 [Polyangiaceae bacterium]|jgi:hypothetical protein